MYIYIYKYIYIYIHIYLCICKSPAAGGGVRRRSGRRQRAEPPSPKKSLILYDPPPHRELSWHSINRAPADCARSIPDASVATPPRARVEVRSAAWGHPRDIGHHHNRSIDRSIDRQSVCVSPAFIRSTIRPSSHHDAPTDRWIEASRASTWHARSIERSGAVGARGTPRSLSPT